MKNYLIFPLCFLLFTGMSCRKIGNSSTECSTFTILDDQRQINKKIEEANDPVEINSATLNNSILTISVSYGGGCQEHCFNLIGTNLIMESYPPQVNFHLTHDANNDLCRALISENLEFDIGSFLPFEGNIFIVQDQQRVRVDR